jgi:tetratricopeptide (TPR) repeat protein
MSGLDRTGRWGLAAAATVAVVGALAWSQPASTGSDLWWHLAAGRAIWEHGGPPATDSLSFTAQGREWINHEWLWDGLAWGAYRAHPDLLAWTHLAVIAALFALLWHSSRRLSGSSLAAGASLWLAAATSHWFFELRPHLWTLLFLAIVMATREWRGRLWLWPVLTAVWANLHGGFVFGVGAIGLFAVVRTIEESRAQRRFALPTFDWITASLCVLAWLANPWGVRALEYPFQYLDGDSPFRDILEWHPPAWTWDPRFYGGRFAWMTLLAAAGMPRVVRRAPALAALAAVAFAMAATSRRFIPVFAVAATPLVAIALSSAVDAIVRRWHTRAKGSGGMDAPAVGWALIAAAAAVALLLWHGTRLTPDPLDRWTLRDRFPEAAVRYLAALEPPARLLNEYDWGGYVMLHLPESRVFIDGRANTLYNESEFLDARALRQLDDDWQDRLARIPVDAALLRRGPLVVYSDATAVVLLPPDSPLLPRAAATLETLLDTPEFYQERAYRTLVAGDAGDAIRQVEAEIARNPNNVAAWVQLALMQANLRDGEAVARTFRAARRANPRRHRDLASGEAHAYGRLGDSERAERAARRAAPRGPFDQPAPGLSATGDS